MNRKKKKSEITSAIAFVPIDKSPEFNKDIQPVMFLPQEETQDFIVDKDEWPELEDTEEDLKGEN